MDDLTDKNSAEGQKQDLTSDPRAVWIEQLLLSAGVLLYFAVSFAISGAFIGKVPQHRLMTPLDEAIPLLPWTVVVYSWVYTSSLFPAFVIQSPSLFRRVALSYAAVLTLALICFWIYPVTALGLRPALEAIDDRHFVGWALRLTYTVDAPYHLFPSLHVGFATITALSCWKAARWLGILASPVVVATAVTICTTKQHYVLDGVAGLLLGVIVYRLLLARFVPSESAPHHRGIRGVGFYFAFHCLFYALFYCLYLTGFRLW